jgi:hypothetical protein
MIAGFFDYKVKIIVNKKKAKKMLYYPIVTKIKKYFIDYKFNPLKECISAIIKKLN